MKNLIFKKITIATILTSTFSFAAGDINDPSGLSCDAPKSKIYKMENLNAAKEFDLMADFPNVLKNRPPVKGVLRFKKQDGSTELMPVLLSGRGNSRGNNCSFKPFRMAFVTAETKKTLDEKSINKDKLSQSALLKYYTDFVNLNYDTKLEGEVEKKSLFDHVGDDIKVVTHCGKDTSGRDWPGGIKEEDQDQRLLAEYYVYKQLEVLKLPVEAVSLAKMTYFNANGVPVFTNDNNAIISKFAFFREPPTSLAKRCGLLSKKTPAMNNIKSNANSEFLTNVINGFVMNTDFNMAWGDKQGHNINYLYTANGERFFGAYDFDLSGPVNPSWGREMNLEALTQYFKSKKVGFAQTLNSFADRSVSKAVVNRFLGAEVEMKNIINSSLLNDAYKEKMNLWLGTQMEALKEYKQKN